MEKEITNNSKIGECSVLEIKEKQAFPFIKEASINNTNLNDWIFNNKQEFDNKLCEHGAILFRGFNINTVAKFEKISKLFDTDSLEYAFRSSPRFSVGKNVYTSTSYPKDFSINMHSEASYMPNGHPGYIIFCCINPATERGETPIADNRLVLSFLSKETKTKFLEKGVRYIRNLNKNIGLSWQEVFQSNDKNHVESECDRTGIDYRWKSEEDLELTWVKKAIWEHPKTKQLSWFNHASFFNKFTLEKDYYGSVKNEDQLPNNTFYGDGTEITKEEIEEIINAYKKSTIEFPWKKGDVLFLDNMLCSHGRNPYEGNRKIVTSLF
ncbi:TauD/TfdA family dioxygenase [Aquimarina muelleri]|uniref:Protein AmbD n=1 Tax=Aquimarina muelleri TaxID=279356 RepID=A0A918JUH0_9FLAO|nr:TauD/TfdA family dioxygenase [Aquimarina muelleri]MCX2762223.1 TauD/TfdA family dioxygenase [Aquimarina muelleri]GGX16517.1 protein AmbD [Aquimarina muelleri]